MRDVVNQAPPVSAAPPAPAPEAAADEPTFGPSGQPARRRLGIRPASGIFWISIVAAVHSAMALVALDGFCNGLQFMWERGMRWYAGPLILGWRIDTTLDWSIAFLIAFGGSVALLRWAGRLQALRERPFASVALSFPLALLLSVMLWGAFQCCWRYSPLVDGLARTRPFQLRHEWVALVVSVWPIAMIVSAPLHRPLLRTLRWVRGSEPAVDAADPIGDRLCALCDYELRGIPIGSRCPECGAIRPAPSRLFDLGWRRGIRIGMLLLAISFSINALYTAIEVILELTNFWMGVLRGSIAFWALYLILFGIGVPIAGTIGLFLVTPPRLDAELGRRNSIVRRSARWLQVLALLLYLFALVSLANAAPISGSHLYGVLMMFGAQVDLAAVTCLTLVVSAVAGEICRQRRMARWFRIASLVMIAFWACGTVFQIGYSASGWILVSRAPGPSQLLDFISRYRAASYTAYIGAEAIVLSCLALLLFRLWRRLAPPSDPSSAAPSN